MLWKQLKSVRLTILLLTLLIVQSVVGTLIAQQGQTQTPIEKLYSVATLKWLVFLGLTDLFHSSYFIFTILLLALNLLACSIERLPKVWKETFHVEPPPQKDPFLKEWDPLVDHKKKYISHRLSVGSFHSVREAKAASLLFFQKYFGRYEVGLDNPEAFQIRLEQGKFSRLGVYITHLSLLLIMAGAVLGALFGFEAGMSIEEGTRQNWIQHFKGSRANMVPIQENGVIVPNVLNLGFEVECEKFELETYDGQRPKAFRSKLNFYENNRKAASAEIEVNKPFVYKGITFYQASYSEAGPGRASINVYRKKTVELVENIRPGDLYRIDGNAAFKVLAFEPNLMNVGLAAKIQYFASKQIKKPTEFWIFQKLPGFDFAHRKTSDYHFVLESVFPKYSTGLSVARDPGVWVVWIGSAILILALFIALYTCHRRYWVSFSEQEGFVVVGWSNKRFLFEPLFEKFLQEFRKELSL